MPEIFPVDDVRAAAADGRLQASKRRAYRDIPGFFDDLLGDVLEREPGVDLSMAEWVWFTSPEWTWAALCGRAGWMLWNPETGEQFHFHCEVIN